MPGRVRSVGRAVPRKEGLAKVTGAAKYVDDLSFPGMLHGRTFRSTIPRGEIRSIRPRFDLDGFTIADFRDIPGKNVVALIENDQPCLAERRIEHFAEPILLVAHEDLDAVRAARIDIEQTSAPALYDPEKSDVGFKRVRIE